MKKKLRRLCSVAISVAMLATMAIPSVFAEDSAPVFKTADADSIYAGMPLFDGEPDHLDAYLDTLFAYVGEEGMIRYSLGYRGDYQLRFGENAGKIIPGAELFGDHVQGVSTDFPAILGLGNSWDKDLIKEVGDVIGTENLYTCDFLDTISNFNAVTCTALQDLRINPLSGRFDEGFSEDYLLNSILLSSMAAGGSGIEEEGNEDGFWTKAIITTKHYTNYAAQFTRLTGNVSTGIRSLMDTQARTILRGVSSGAVGGVMSSYGRTNGVPNSISPLIQWMQSFGPWTKDGGVFLLTDFSSDWQLYYDNAFGNGYDDSYTPAYREALPLLMVARTTHTCANDRHSLENPNYKYHDELAEELKNGTAGVTYEDLYLTASSAVTQLIRCGVFNERDENGLPVKYPFTDYSLNKGAETAVDGNVYDYSNPQHQAIALQAAQDSVVLLKNNNNVLPLNKNANVMVSGTAADARYKTTYAVGRTPTEIDEGVENAFLTIGEGIERVGKNVQKAADVNIITFKSQLNGKYFVAAADGKLTATAEKKEDASKFEAYSWGQDGAYNYKCLDEGELNGKWLTFSVDRKTGAVTFKVNIDGTETLKGNSATLSASSYSTNNPTYFSVQANENGSASILANCYTTSFFTSASSYYGSARVITVAEDGSVGATAAIASAADEANLRGQAANQVQIETVQKTGTLAAEADADYAVVVVGAPTRLSAGEGNDRSDLALGADQYEQVKNTAAAYPGKTIVVVNGVFPFLLEEIQNNQDVAAILFMPYGGQYDGYAMGQTIFGDSVPTGKLTSTWYASMDALPEMDEYTLAEGPDATMTGMIPPRYHTDFSNGDEQENGLTYRYTDADITYPFGYGISYTTFAYSDFSVSSQDADGNLTATVTVKNTGEVDSAEIVQIYANNPDSSYGAYAPKKTLVAFDKVQLKAGESKTVQLTIEAQDLAQWDTNSDTYNVESGTYKFMVGASSEDMKAAVDVAVQGEGYGNLDITTPVNVFDKSFAADDVVYLEYSKAHTNQSLVDDKLINGNSVVMGKHAGSWVVMNNVDLSNVESFTANVAYNGGGLAGIELRIDSPDGAKIGEVYYAPTNPVTYTVDAVTDYEVTELGYTDVSFDNLADVDGVHDLYVVFKNAEARINTLQAVKAEAPDIPSSSEPSEPDGPSSSEPSQPGTSSSESQNPNPSQTSSDETQSPTTGDNTNMMIPLLICGAALCAAAGVLLVKKSKKSF